jgi:RNA polymerase sigma-70 factor (ECF subfamily)
VVAKQNLAEDASWIATIRHGTRVESEECFRKLMLKYWKLVLVLARDRLGDPREAEDVAQEAFLRAFRSLDKLEEPVAFLGWLLRIARNLVTDQLRGRRRGVSVDTISEPALPSEAQTSLEREEEARMAVDAVSELPEKYREVVLLKYVQGLDGKTMARVLGEPEGTVRNRLFRALEKVRTRLEQKGAQRA